MTAREALDALVEFFDVDPQLEVATVAKPPAQGQPPEPRVLNLSGDAEAFFRDTITSAVLDEAEGWSLRKLDPTYKPDAGTIEWVELADVDAVEFVTGHLSNLAPFAPFDSGDDAYKKRLAYWAAVATRGNRQAFFFRSFSPTAELSRKAGTALVSRNGTFRKVEEEIFLFDERIDCFVFRDFLFVIRKNDYRRIFDQYEEIRRQAKRAARKLHERVPIANFAEFEKACAGQAAMADKIIAVTTRDYFNTLTLDLLKPVITEFGLAILVQPDGDGNKQLVFKSEPEHRWRIIKLVDDDYLRSSMTNLRYEVNSKTAPPA